MWPNAKIGVMGSEQLTAVMETVGKAVDPELKARIERESEAVFSSARLWVCLQGQKSWVHAKK
jgi:3-methylcrotonyl-CoA carboxylase beta subunit